MSKQVIKPGLKFREQMQIYVPPAGLEAAGKMC